MYKSNPESDYFRLSSKDYISNHEAFALKHDRWYTVDVDIGGTYTDAVIADQGGAHYIKTDTTPGDLSQCFRDVIEKGTTLAGFTDTRLFLRKILVIRLSTSLSTNTLIEGKGACVGLLMSEGRKTSYLKKFFFTSYGQKILLPDMVEEIARDPDDESIREKAFSLLTRGVATIVVALDGPDDFPAAENRIKTEINQYFPKHFIGSVPVLLSSRTSRDRDYFKRLNTTLLNAYTRHALSGHIQAIEDFLRSGGLAYPLLIVHSNGGSSRPAKCPAIQTLSSGAAAGIYGARNLARFYGKSRAVVADIGGTSTEIGMIHQEHIAYAPASRIREMPVDLLSPIHSILGLGGGSVVKLDGAGRLSFGPESVGAFPGPACYDLGGKDPTLTDAYLVLGYFDENHFLGGQRRVHKGPATGAIEKGLAAPLGVAPVQAASMIQKEAVRIIGNQIRKMLAAEGKACHEFSLFAVGGGGGCIGSDLMEFCGFQELFVFRQGPVFGAYGSSGMDILHQYKEAASILWGEKQTDFSDVVRQLNRIILELQKTAGDDMSGEGFSPAEIQFDVVLECRSASTGRTCRLPLASPFLWPETDKVYLSEKIDSFFRAPSGAPTPEDRITITGVLVNARGKVPHAEPMLRKEKSPGKLKPMGVRSVYRDGGYREVPVFSWDETLWARSVRGPAIVESRETTVWVKEGQTAEFDEYGNGVVGKA